MEKVKYSHNPNYKIGTCLECGEEMVYNVPRLGANGGFIHKETKGLGCKIKLGGIKFPKKLIPSGGNDCVMTPKDLAKKVVGHFSHIFMGGDKFLEPCRGTGSFVSAIENYGYLFELGGCIDWCELTDGVDFLEKDFGDKKYDHIITNPPFSKFRSFLKKSMNLADNIVFLCTINHIFGLRARLRDIKGAGFFIRECLLCDTPKSWPSSGFQVGAVYLSKHAGDCKISYL